MLDTIFNELFGKFLIYFFRDAVRAQYQAIGVTLIVSFVIARALIYMLDKYAPQLENREGRWGTLLQHSIAFAKLLIFPLIALIMIEVRLLLFTSRNELVGVLEDATFVLTLFLIYRFLIAIAYEIFEHKTVKRLHQQLLTPLFTIFVLNQVLNDFIRFSNLGQITLFEGLDNPLTISRVFWVIFGLYFWITAVLRLGELLQTVINKYTNVTSGKLEGALTLTEYLLIGLSIYAALIMFGINATTIAAITGGLSVGIGFGMREIVTSFIGGIILLFEGSIEPGDILTLDNDRADVKKLGVRSTLVERDDGTELLIPNAMLFESQVTKRTGSDSLIRTILRIRASYKDDPEKVMQVLADASASFPKVLDTPNPPKAFIDQFGEYYILYRLEVWTDHRVIGPVGVRKNLNPRIYKAFREHGIEMPYPQQNIQFSTADGAPPAPIAGALGS